MLNLSQTEQEEILTIASKQEKSFRRKLSANKNVIFAINLVRQLHGQIDSLVTEIKQKLGVRFDCKKGCNYCCKLRIEAVPPEVFLIARQLRTLPSADFNKLIANLEEHSKVARGVRMENFNLQCPLLKDNACSIYSIRPVMCRKCCSLNVAECMKPHMQPLESVELVAKASALIYGSIKAYECAKLPNRSHELGQALLLALTDKTLELRWYRGESVFEPIPEQGRHEHYP